MDQKFSSQAQGATMPNTDSSPYVVTIPQGTWISPEASPEMLAYYKGDFYWHLTLKRGSEFDQAGAHLTFDNIENAEQVPNFHLYFPLPYSLEDLDSHITLGLGHVQSAHHDVIRDWVKANWLENAKVYEEASELYKGLYEAAVDEEKAQLITPQQAQQEGGASQEESYWDDELASQHLAEHTATTLAAWTRENDEQEARQWAEQQERDARAQRQAQHQAQEKKDQRAIKQEKRSAKDSKPLVGAGSLRRDAETWLGQLQEVINAIKTIPGFDGETGSFLAAFPTLEEPFEMLFNAIYQLQDAQPDTMVIPDATPLGNALEPLNQLYDAAIALVIH
ncbi:MAG: hypothetical protein H0W34_07875, partial [Pyrinomonadaceae bacterium]|nr:hypothetical protein [Pyrinomonadaceae bacterium]